MQFKKSLSKAFSYQKMQLVMYKKNKYLSISKSNLSGLCKKYFASLTSETTKVKVFKCIAIFSYQIHVAAVRKP